MGACSFLVFEEGKTAQEAFSALVAEAVWEYGHNPYNGTISTTRLHGAYRKIADEWTNEVSDAARKIAEDDHFGKKWESKALDCGKTENGLHMWAFYGRASC